MHTVVGRGLQRMSFVFHVEYNFWLVRRWLPLWKRPFRSVVYMLSRYPSDRSVVYMLCAILQIICSRRVVATHWSCPIQVNLYSFLHYTIFRKGVGEAYCRCSLSGSALLNPLLINRCNASQTFDKTCSTYGAFLSCKSHWSNGLVWDLILGARPQ